MERGVSTDFFQQRLLQLFLFSCKEFLFRFSDRNFCTRRTNAPPCVCLHDSGKWRSVDDCWESRCRRSTQAHRDALAQACGDARHGRDGAKTRRQDQQSRRRQPAPQSRASEPCRGWRGAPQRLAGTSEFNKNETGSRVTLDATDPAHCASRAAAVLAESRLGS